MSWTKEYTRQYMREYNLRNREKLKAAKAAKYLIKREEIRKKAKDNYPQIAARAKERAADRRRKFPDKCAAEISRWQKQNPDKVKALNDKHRSAKRKAIPRWADLQKIREFYKQAKLTTIATGIKHHVDHIVPVQSKLVCGLHVENNLQIIPGKINCGKQNRKWPDMPEVV